MTERALSATASTVSAPRLRNGLQAFHRWLHSSPHLLAWPVPLLLLSLWWLGSHQGWIAPQTLPSPHAVFTSLYTMVLSGEAWEHLSISLQRVFIGFLIGASSGFLLGLGMGASVILRELFHPSFRLIACVPLLGWLPLLMLMFGIDELLKVILIAKAAVIPVTLNTYQGIRDVPHDYQEVARLYGFGRWQRLRCLLLPSALPSIWAGLRYGLTHCWLVLVLVELLSSSEGLGYLMSNGQQLMQMDVLLVAVILVGLVGFLIDRLLEQIERHLLRWRREAFT